MCYLSASSTGERGAHVFRVGILILAVPTLLAFAGIILLVYRRRNSPGSTENPFATAQDDNVSSLLSIPTGEQDHPYSAF